MPTPVTPFDICRQIVCWNFSSLSQNECIIPVYESIVCNVGADGDCPFHGMLFFTHHDDFTDDLKTPRARILREDTCAHMQTNPEQTHGQLAESANQSGETTFRQECIQNFRELDSGRQLEERKVPFYINALGIQHLDEFEKYLSIMSHTSEFPSLVEVCAASRVMKINTIVVSYNAKDQMSFKPLACYKDQNTDNCICLLLHGAHFYAVLPNDSSNRILLKNRFGYDNERISFGTWRPGPDVKKNLWNKFSVDRTNKF